MMLRLLFALGSVAILAALLYLQDNEGSAADVSLPDLGNTEPGFAAVRAQLIETGEDGLPLYRLYADRIEQPQPGGLVYLTNPKLDYQVEHGNHWTLTAQQGQMPQNANSADLSGTVHAEGLPTGSQTLMRIDTEQLHLDMTQHLATSPLLVRVSWGQDRLDGRDMRADLQNDTLTLASKVHGVLFH
jgi:LPS export ABC transporter protein LptC